ncbi:anthranilate synthase component I family protein [Curtobacterium sp. MCSS17_007]|uniref:anthranilate synthase component I family protein n=1 Tax=Curtobacterium sp. MCSS17_007 TaxID=2175646 RepID=UPI0015E89A73|nr:anthranilate synthase component I family protein [Curtobacterium sp. MCSS17_007]WIE76607.1 anthranilate synthase component I family protein [Curtobacterium sp. MCSS17_007]
MDDRRRLTGPRVVARRLDGTPDLGALADASHGDVVWLDSGLPDGAPDTAHERARWSVLAQTDGPFATRFRHEGRRAVVDVPPAAERWFGTSRVEDRPAFAVLGDLLDRTPALAAPVVGCGFALGWVGFLGYELGRESGGPDRTADGHADADLRFVDRAVVVHADGRAWALALVTDDEPAASAANRAWLDEPHVSVTRGGLPDAATGLPVGATGRVSRAAYEAAVETCRAEIREGNAFQVCLTTVFAVGAVGAVGREARVAPGADPHLDEYLRLRRADPVPFGAYLRLGPLRVASRSPERFLRVGADDTVVAEPIKGTRRRDPDPERDAVVRAGLMASAKDRAENVMIVDLLRNDLLRTAVPGSVHVERLCDVETYASVHQLVSTVSAVLPPGTARAAVVRAAFPPGSMTGAPKISAMAVADRLEDAPRGVYSGAVGYFSADGSVDLSVAIRTLVTVLDDRGAERSRSYGAGGAVTWSSVAADEADEVETKTRSVFSALGVTARW